MKTNVEQKITTTATETSTLIGSNLNDRRFLYFINPIAGTKPKQDLEKFLETQTTKQGFEYHSMYSERSMDSKLINHTIEDLNITDIIVCGGDGTVNLVANAIQYTDVRFGILPVGSGNGLARCAGIPMNPKAALDVILNGNAQATDAFKVNDYFSCMLSGLGMDAAVAERFSKKATRGLYTYTTQTLIEFFKANPYQFGIELPGEFSFYSDAFFISIANSNQFGNNVTIAPKASLSDGLLDIVIVQKMPKANIPLAVMKQLRGNNKLTDLAESVGKQNVIYLQTPSLHINNEQFAPLHIDGDPVETTTHFSIEILPKALNLIVP